MTTVHEIEKLLHDYRAWLKDNTTLREVNGDWVEITTPYLDRHNDALQIYARAENGGYVLTDDSYTIHDLEASGCNGFEVRMNNEAIEVHASAENFPARKHNLIQAILSRLSRAFFLKT
jgi:hypothetical protein